MSDLSLAVGLATLLAVVFLAIIVYARSGRNTSRIGSLEARGDGTGELQKIHNRLGALETEIGKTHHDLQNVRMVVNNLPNKDATHRMELELREVAGKVAKLDGDVTATTRATERIEEILLRGIKL